jgi:streptogramin lyase
VGGNGFAAVPLLQSGMPGVLLDTNNVPYVSTDEHGSFTITSDYTCPVTTGASGPDGNVYLLALGGNPGLDDGTDNSALSLMAGLGACSLLNATTAVNVDEASTVVTAYALAGFMTGPTTLSRSSTTVAQSALTAAFAQIPKMLNIAAGTPLAATLTGNAVVPQAQLDTLANILSTCVNSTGPDSTACVSMFTQTTPQNGSAPSDTLSAMLNIVRHPGQDVGALFNLASSSGPFQPTLSIAPLSWTLPVTYTGGGIGSVTSLSVDGNGNVWAATRTNTLTEISPSGTFVSGPFGYTPGGLENPSGIAVDCANNVYVANAGGGLTYVSGADGNGAWTLYLSSTPTSVAVDGNCNAWVGSSAGPSVFVASSNESLDSPTTGYSGGGSTGNTSIVIDESDSAWLTANASNAVVELAPGGGAVSPSGGYTAGPMSGPTSAAVDRNGAVWVTNSGGSSVTRLTGNGPTIKGTNFTGGGLSHPTAIAVDGDDTFWIINSGNSTLTHLGSDGSALSPSTGFYVPLSSLQCIAVDGGGNVWIGGNNVLAEFVGVAAPVVVPMGEAVDEEKIGVRP